MRVTLEIPDEMARRLGETAERISRCLLELAAVGEFRTGRFSRHQVRKLLGLSWQETEELLARHECHRHYGLRELEEDRRTLDKVFPRIVKERGLLSEPSLREDWHRPEEDAAWAHLQPKSHG